MTTIQTDFFDSKDQKPKQEKDFFQVLFEKLNLEFEFEVFKRLKNANIVSKDLADIKFGVDPDPIRLEKNYNLTDLLAEYKKKYPEEFNLELENYLKIQIKTAMDKIIAILEDFMIVDFIVPPKLDIYPDTKGIHLRINCVFVSKNPKDQQRKTAIDRLLEFKM